jgi:hypothetical protein
LDKNYSCFFAVRVLVQLDSKQNSNLFDVLWPKREVLSFWVTMILCIHIFQSLLQTLSHRALLSHYEAPSIDNLVGADSGPESGWFCSSI